MMKILRETRNSIPHSKDARGSTQSCIIKGVAVFTLSLSTWISQTTLVLAQSQGVCDTYRIAPGDTLRGIALKFFDDGDINALYSKNRDVIGSNPNIILAGVKLQIPCTVTPNSVLAEDARKAERVAAEQTQARVAAEALAEKQTQARVEAEELAAQQETARMAAEALAADQEKARIAAEKRVMEQAQARVEAEELAAQQETARMAAEALAADQEKARIAAEKRVTEQAQARADAEALANEQKQQILKLQEEIERQKQEADAVVSTGKVTLLAANDYVPYTDENLAGQGLITEIVQAALLRINPDLDFDIKFVNDRNSHIDTLLPSFAFETSFPWAKPQCDKPEILTGEYIAVCNTYNFSQPLYDIVEGFIARKGSAFETAVNYDQFEGARICRADGFPTDHLLVLGLIVDDSELVRPLRVNECFEKLLLGTVDLISIDIQVAETIITSLGLDSKITNNKNLAVIRSLHAIAHKDSQRGNDLLLLLDNGVTTIRKSGEWFDIASKRLQEQVNE